MTKSEAITTAKQFRVDADALLQRMKEHRYALASGRRFDSEDEQSKKDVDDYSETIAQHTLSIRDLESCIMRQGMALKNIGNENPYPNSYDPSNTKVDPTADNLKL
jgi:hypothetical protein